MISGFKFFSIYFPIHLHFNTKYDLFKYYRKSKSITRELFDGRKDKNRFEQYGARFKSEKEAGKFALANFVYNDIDWLYDEYSSAKEVFSEWERIHNSLTTQFKNDINVLSKAIEGKKVQSVERLFSTTDQGNVAPIIQLEGAGQISKECLCLIDLHILPCLSRFAKYYEHDPLVSSEVKKLQKYEPFLNHVEPKSIISTFKEFYKNHER